MTTEDRRGRERPARRRLITATARTLAEGEGWDAVTTRRLSTEIECSQPVLYKHLALHGLVMLGRNGRLRPGYDADRVELLVARFRDAGSAASRASAPCTVDGELRRLRMR
jgi:hypothetical protein